MTHKPCTLLTDHELRLMAALWRLGHATVTEVVAGVATPTLAHNTVLTTLQKLEAKGYVKHAVSRRAFVFRPLIARQQAALSAVRWLLLRFFDNSPDLLLSTLQTDAFGPASDRSQ
ncbi:MAG TPA: BlaI/MecI/CopY family transcriptional regulator [Candidatus Cybelea sp.]|jgi:predicted transcriptional regulator|nr:BlaI/MecI/CopY family transcriptional regulator [Candidatus Cybelea sp.]